VIVVHCVSKGPRERSAETPIVARKMLEPGEPVPPGAIWIDMIEPTPEEDQKVQDYLGCEIPTRSDPDYTEPPEAHYSENGVRYLHAMVLSEPGGHSRHHGRHLRLGPDESGDGAR
jgi:magnesium transporter